MFRKIWRHRDEELITLYNYLLGREPSDIELKSLRERIQGKLITKRQVAYQIMLSAEATADAKRHAKDIHPYCIHRARIIMITSLLPPAKIIVDLGGANGSIFDMGYQYTFDRLTVVDLPAGDRCDMYKDIEMTEKITHLGPIYVRYGSMTDLHFIHDASVDLVWSGQSIEHIMEHDACKVFSEVRRILKPEGNFCLDTPNRLITEIHTGSGGWIHSEHKIEYYPAHLKSLINSNGFTITAEKGICEMPKTWETKQFDYSDFVLGNPLSNSVESSYIQYYACRKEV